MKRIALFILCFTLLLGTVSCGQDKPAGTKSGTEGATEGVTETVTDTEDQSNNNKMTSDNETESDDTSTHKFEGYTMPCNGTRDSKVKYIINPDGKFNIYIEEWDEIHQVLYFTENDVNIFSRYITFAMALNNQYGFLIFRELDTITNSVVILRFERGVEGEVVNQIKVDESICVFWLSCNFINDQQGYLFVCEEGCGDYANEHVQLSYLFKTENGGNTWNQVKIQTFSSMARKEGIVFAKMVDENIGIISGRHYSDDHTFCEYTRLTTDGGSNWVYFPELPKMDDFFDLKVTDFTKEGDRYILTLQYSIINEKKNEYLQYMSFDLNTWNLVN